MTNNAAKVLQKFLAMFVGSRRNEKYNTYAFFADIYNKF